ncbi:MAG: Gfo/Idh/MocA family oxidoreductase [candidate division Zixibacteria bacterium]|nr:Gfo/Idh/MocA family oxidoreductase [candidate division Zixibacteria bacterium]
MINVGVIGYGYWGPNMVRNFYANKDARVVKVCDLSKDRLALVERGYPTIKTTTDYKELAKDREIDAVVIATPVSNHFPAAQEALENDKHVLLEKPMTATVEESEKLIELAEKKNKKLMVDHTFLYTGAVRKMKELVESGELGDLYYFDSVRVNLGLFQHDVNVIWDLAPHDFSIMDFLLQKDPEMVSAVGVCHLGDLENMAYITVQYPGNLLGHIHVNWLAPAKVRTTLIGGTKKMIIYDDTEPSEKVKIYDKGVSYHEKREDVYQMLVQYRSGDMLAPKLETTEALRLVSEEFTDCISENRKPLTDGVAGLRVVKLLQSATESMKQKGKVVRV